MDVCAVRVHYSQGRLKKLKTLKFVPFALEKLVRVIPILEATYSFLCLLIYIDTTHRNYFPSG